MRLSPVLPLRPTNIVAGERVWVTGFQFECFLEFQEPEIFRGFVRSSAPPRCAGSSLAWPILPLTTPIQNVTRRFRTHEFNLHGISHLRSTDECLYQISRMHLWTENASHLSITSARSPIVSILWTRSIEIRLSFESAGSLARCACLWFPDFQFAIGETYHRLIDTHDLSFSNYLSN